MGLFRRGRIAFPPVETTGEDGLLMLGGELSPDWMLEGYRRGVFAWPLCFGGKEILAWFAPDPRAIIELDGFHVSRSLQRLITARRFEVRYDAAFDEVVAACALPRKPGEGIWITSDMQAAYRELHVRGDAHSVEAWREGRLAGGVFGVTVGGLFAAESMFHRETDASKVALFYLVERLRSRGFSMLDIQVWSPHTGRLGAMEIPRVEYQRRLREAMKSPAKF